MKSSFWATAFVALFALSLPACELLRDTLNNPSNTTMRCVPVSNAEFSRFFSTVQSRNFEQDKLEAAKQVTQQARCLTTQQIYNITSSFDFERTRLDYAKFAYPFCANPRDYGMINNLFDFDSSKRELGQLTGVN